MRIGMCFCFSLNYGTLPIEIAALLSINKGVGVSWVPQKSMRMLQIKAISRHASDAS